jgi:hypothetical protein
MSNRTERLAFRATKETKREMTQLVKDLGSSLTEIVEQSIRIAAPLLRNAKQLSNADRESDE